MNKLYIYVAAAVLLIGGGAGAYYLTSNRNSPSESVSTASNSAGTTQSSEKKTILDLFSSGVAQRCTFSSAESSGTVLASSGKMRGDFNTQIDGESTVSHMITDGQTSYVWMDNQDMGFKMTVDLTDPEYSADSDSKIRGQGQMDLDQPTDFSCTPWVVDNSVYEVPSEIQFSDFSSMMNPSTLDTQVEVDSSAEANPNASQCAACDSAPADYREQCRTALGCE